jgi:hypothetical protein
MDRHRFIDRFVAGMGGLYGESLRFFNRNIESLAVADLIRGAEIPEVSDLSELPTDEIAVTVNLPNGAVATRCRIVQDRRPAAPVLIFHHGSGDHPYHTRIRKIMRAATEESRLGEFTIIATDSPYNISRKEYFGAVGDLEKFAAILAASTVLIEAIVQAVRRTPGSRITVTGISLGGWISNLHHAFLDTADEYRPVFAGAAPDALFLDSAYTRLTSAKALANPDRISAVLNFEDAFIAVPNAHVHALLGRYDQYVMLDRQRSVYRDENLTIIDRGHVTGSIATAEIAGFLAAGISRPAAREAWVV